MDPHREVLVSLRAHTRREVVASLPFMPSRRFDVEEANAPFGHFTVTEFVFHGVPHMGSKTMFGNTT